MGRAPVPQSDDTYTESRADDGPRRGEPHSPTGVECAPVQARRPSDSSSVLTRWMGIEDANAAGYVHGGVIMRLCDEVAGIAAIRHCGVRVVTAGMDRMTFLDPVHVGQLVTFRATVNAAWRTSMEVGVRVDSEHVRTREVTHTSTAYLTMVALDDEGRPTPVPPLEPETATERRREHEAQLRRDNRLAEREAILQVRAEHE
jgi:acyl-CoA hydrolase